LAPPSFFAFLIYLVGTGAIGCIYGWRISQTAAVTTVCRSNYDVVRRDGFEIQSKKWGGGTFRPFKGMIIFDQHKQLAKKKSE
jgi:ketopantoate reductase